MNNIEFLKMISEVSVDTDKVLKLISVYGKGIPETIERIVSCNETTIFLDKIRILSYDEILDATTELHVDFVAKKLVPIADCGDNDFVVYHLKDKVWSKYNIIEDCSFKRKEKFEDYLL